MEIENYDICGEDTNSNLGVENKKGMNNVLHCLIYSDRIETLKKSVRLQ